MTSQITSAASSATYTKLRDGSWGLRVTGPTPTTNQKVTVVKRDGTRKTEHIAAILWSSDGVHLCSISQCFSSQRSLSPQRGGSGRGVRGTWTGCSCGSVEEYERRGDCASCRHDR